MTCIWLIEEGTKNENHVPCTWNNLLDVQIKKRKTAKNKQENGSKKKKERFLVAQRKEMSLIN